MSRKSRRTPSEEKRQAVLAASGRRRGGDGEARKIVLGGLAVGLLATALLVFSQARSAGGRFEVVQARDGTVRLPVARVGDGRAHFFTYRWGSRAIDFFVLKSSDGVLRAAFDTCDICYPDRKGYRQEGDLMVCNKCEQKFPSALVNERRGGCNPAPLERTVDGDVLVLRSADLEAGARYF